MLNVVHVHLFRSAAYPVTALVARLRGGRQVIGFPPKPGSAFTIGPLAYNDDDGKEVVPARLAVGMLAQVIDLVERGEAAVTDMRPRAREAA